MRILVEREPYIRMTGSTDCTSNEARCGAVGPSGWGEQAETQQDPKDKKMLFPPAEMH